MSDTIECIGERNVERSACGKVILCGEHAVVYGRPAIALPLPGLRATVTLKRTNEPLVIDAPDVGQRVRLADCPIDTQQPLARMAHLTLAHLGQPAPCATLTVRSAIPVGANLGSGAAVSIALGRAIAAHFGRELAPADASALAFEVEKLHHGTPSGIDNTVVAFEQPVWFVRGQAPEVLPLQTTFDAGDAGGTDGTGRARLVIADTGFSTPTRVPVGDVRTAWERDRARYEHLFDDIAVLVRQARTTLVKGDWQALGEVMNANQRVLRQLGVSCAELDGLCAAALQAGALGAKMSGGGRGGNMIALARNDAYAEQLRTALLVAGAKRVLV